MNVDLEDIRAMAARCPNMRINTLLHHLEKRQKVEELRKERENAPRTYNDTNDKPLWSPFTQWLGRWS